MSEENVELWRRAVEDFLVCTSEADWEDWITSLCERLDPAIEWDASLFQVPDLRGVYHGIEAVQHWWREWFGAWETLKFEYELVDAGDRVVLLLDQRMQGRSTGIEVPMGKYAHVASYRAGLMVHWKVYPSQSQALEAVGLRA